MVNTNLSTLVDHCDKFGVKIGSWAVETSPGYFKCQICTPSKILSFKKGKKDLLQHSESERHQKLATSNNNNSKQPSLLETLQKKKSDDTVEKAKDLENAIVLMVSRHGIQHAFVDCLVNTLKKYVVDSEIVKKLKLGKDKTGYLVNYGLGDHFEAETVEMLRNCVSFSASIDESEVNKRSELEVMVNIATKEGVNVLRHYTCLDIEKTNADTIVNKFLESFEVNNINVQDKMVGCGTDGCATMLGKNNGVQKKLRDHIPQLADVGSCNSHHLSNAMQHSLKSFDTDVKEVCVHVYQDLGGSVGLGLKRKKEYEALCLTIGHKPKTFVKFFDIRFRTIRFCTESILFNFDSLAHYYSSLKGKLSWRQELLKSFFVDRRDMAKIKLYFVHAATADLSDAVDFFESRNFNVHNAGNKLENILLTQMRKVIDESELNILSENDTIETKPRDELVNLDVDNVRKLNNKQLFIGSSVETYIKKLGLTPSSKQLNWFFSAVTKFHISAVKKLQFYFKTALESSVLKHLNSLSPNMQSHVATSHSLLYLKNNFLKVVKNIDIDGMDKINSEIHQYVTDEDVKMLDKSVDITDYWNNVGEITDGAAAWKRYEILPKFCIALGVIFVSNSEVERTFSLMNNIYQNKQRCGLSQQSLNSILHIKSGVESITRRTDCAKCDLKESSYSHCHCSQVDLTGEIRISCANAARKYKTKRNEEQNNKDLSSDEFNKKAEEFAKAEIERLSNVKEKLSRKLEFCSQKLLEPVFDTESKKRKAPENDNKTNKKSK